MKRRPADLLREEGNPSAFDGVERVTERTITPEQIVEHYTCGTWPSKMVQCDFMKIVGDLAVAQLKSRAKPREPAAAAACDCLNECGDDPWLKDGRALACDALQAMRARKDLPRAIGVSRIADNDYAVLVAFRVPLTDEQLVVLHDVLSGGKLA